MTVDASAEHGWTQLNDDFADKELRREVSEGHVLFGVAVKGIKRCGDDVLFELTQPAQVQVSACKNAKYAEVHLTWCSNGPDVPPWPETQFYSNLPEWLSKFQTHSQVVVAVASGWKKHFFGMTLLGWTLLFLLAAALVVAIQL